MKKVITAVVMVQSLVFGGNAFADDDPEKYDYRDYARAENISQKVFSTNDPICGQTEQRNYTSSQVGTNTDVAIRRIRQDEFGFVCQNKVFNILKTPRERLLVSKENWNRSGSRLNSTDAPETPVVRRHKKMAEGAVFGSAAATVRTTAGISASNGAIVETNVALGEENVSVPYGTFADCLKVNTQRSSTVFSNFNRVSWFCSGIGEVKRIDTYFDGTSKIWVLTGALVN